MTSTTKPRSGDTTDKEARMSLFPESPIPDLTVTDLPRST